MTLIVALEGKDGLVLASDSRGTIGDPRGLTAVNDFQRKLFRLSKWSGMAVYGSSELAAFLIDKLNQEFKQSDEQGIDEIFTRTQQLAKEQYSNWFGSRTWVSPQPLVDQRPMFGCILAGYTKEHIQRIYLLNSQLDFAPQLCPSGYMLAGIPQYATYLLHRLYDRQMMVLNLRALAAYLIAETASQDPKVGGPIRIASITSANGYEELEESLIKEIIKRNEEQSQKLRQFFFEGGERG